MPRQVRLWSVVAASLFLAVALMNLLLVAEQSPEVRPVAHDGVTWQTGTGAAERSGRHTWESVIEPKERRIVEIDIVLEHRVRVTHVAGEASIVHHASFWVDGERLDEEEHIVTASPRDNSTERISRTWSEPGSYATTLFVPRDAGSPPFVLLVVWEWEVVGEGGASATFETEIRPFRVEAVDVGGIPGCSGTTCGRILVLVAGVTQVGTLFWYRGAPPDPGSGRSDTSRSKGGPPGGRKEHPRR